VNRSINFSIRSLAFLLVGLAVLISSTLRVSADTHSANSATPSSMDAVHAAAKGDPLLEALLTELERSKAQLRMDQVGVPYHIEYRVADVDDFAAEAAFGALRENQHAHVRLLRVVVRIGDYKQDSYYGRGQGESNILPLDNDPIALRRQIWLTTDDAYKAAGQSLAEKQAALKQFSADPNPVDDFAKAPAIISVEPLVSAKSDDAKWKKTLEEVTALYKQYPDIQSVNASVRFTAINEYLINTEGSLTRSGHVTYSLQLTGSTQAADGMRLARSPAYVVAKPEELPSHDVIMADAKKMLGTLVALRQAPIVEETYRGPVLFDADAANDIVTSLIGQNILGRKPQLGKPNRTTGAFATSYKTRVLPNFISVADDPTMKEFGGKSLVGNYLVDDEAVKAQPVTVIGNGTLINYLVGRAPIRDFPASNGHARSAPGSFPAPSLGVLLIKSSEVQSPAELTKKIEQMITDQGHPYAYRVETLGPGNSPRLLYRVYANDGHQELVRGAVFNELDHRALRSDIIAAGNDPLVTNRVGGAPSTVICPSLLFDELEVKRADTSKDKLPDYPPPPLTQK
jgi:TldD protein